MDDELKKYLNNYGEYVVLLSKIDKSLGEHTIILKEISDNFKNGINKKIDDTVNKHQIDIQKSIDILFYKFSGSIILVVTLVILILEFINKLGSK